MGADFDKLCSYFLFVFLSIINKVILTYRQTFRSILLLKMISKIYRDRICAVNQQN